MLSCLRPREPRGELDRGMWKRLMQEGRGAIYINDKIRLPFTLCFVMHKRQNCWDEAVMMTSCCFLNFASLVWGGVFYVPAVCCVGRSANIDISPACQFDILKAKERATNWPLLSIYDFLQFNQRHPMALPTRWVHVSILTWNWGLPIKLANALPAGAKGQNDAAMFWVTKLTFRPVRRDYSC